MKRPVVGRLAPSPTGALHLGNARTFLLAWLSARAQGGRVLLRIEDLDHPHNQPGAEVGIFEDLRWLGLDWDGTHLVQSKRRTFYRETLARLPAYPCICRRSEIEAAQSAPHAGEVLRYSGRCRGRFPDYPSAAAHSPSLPLWRYRLEPGEGRFPWLDRFAGPQSADLDSLTGDFPLARDPDGAGYTLAVVTDDHAQGVTEVVRGDDLLAVTPCQLLLYRRLHWPEPDFFHIPLIVGPDGRRLAKRHGDTRISAFRTAGIPPGKLIAWLAASAGLPPLPTPQSLLAHFTWERIRRQPTVWTGTLDLPPR